jgi:hypothetical protein
MLRNKRGTIVSSIETIVKDIIAKTSTKSRYNDDQLYNYNRISYPKNDFSYLAMNSDKSVLIMSYLQDYENDDNSKNGALVNIAYSNTSGEQKIKANKLKQIIHNVGYTRFNTNIVRNLFFISNILRIVRLQINREFTQNRNILKSSHFAISPSITEYGIMNPNEAYSSKYRGERSFNDEMPREQSYDEV